MSFKNYSSRVPYHINVTPKDLTGNHGLGRYIFLCGSMERAKKISQFFEDSQVKKHARGHDFYYGRIKSEDGYIDVAVISTGIGAPSTDIIFHELVILGGRRFLRVGTCGSLQPQIIKIGDIVIATAGVRDETTSANYITKDFPAVASLEMVNAALSAAKKLSLSEKTFAGIVHSKDSFYAREMACTILEENANYMSYLKQAGVLATEMECSIIFTLAAVIGYYTSEQLTKPQHGILAGAVLAVIGDDTPMADGDVVVQVVDEAINLGIETFKTLYHLEMIGLK